MENSEKHLILHVKSQLFTIDVKHVSTIIQLPKLFKVPQAPEFILGVINVEGEVIPVVDSGIKLNMGQLNVHERAQVVIFQRYNEEAKKYQKLGFLVDEVDDVVDINPKKIQALPTSKYEFDTRLVDGMHKVKDEFCMQININNFYKGEIEDLLNTNIKTK